METPRVKSAANEIVSLGRNVLRRGREDKHGVLVSGMNTSSGLLLFLQLGEIFFSSARNLVGSIPNMIPTSKYSLQAWIFLISSSPDGSLGQAAKSGPSVKGLYAL